MEVEQHIVLWAERHPEIIAVGLGGSRAKGTHRQDSDYDIGVYLTQEPTIALVERLTASLGLNNPGNVFIFGQSDRHFLMIGRKYYINPELSLAFSNLQQFENALKEEIRYPIVEEQLEFLKSLEPLYDPHKKLAWIKDLTMPGWVRRHALQEAVSLAKVHFGKYEKLTGEKKHLGAQMAKFECIWSLVCAAAYLTNIPVGGRYEYEDLKIRIQKASEETNTILPKDFFRLIDECIMEDNAAHIEKLRWIVITTATLAQRILRS